MIERITVEFNWNTDEITVDFNHAGWNNYTTKKIDAAVALVMAYLAPNVSLHVQGSIAHHFRKKISQDIHEF